MVTTTSYELDMLEIERRKVELMKEQLDVFKNIEASLKKLSDLVHYHDRQSGGEVCIKICEGGKQLH